MWSVPNLLTCLFLILYGFFSYRIITTSWWFILFSSAVIVDSSGCAYSVDGDMRHMVYKWRFPYLGYPLELSISLIYLLSPCNWFYHWCTSHHLMPLSYSGVYAHTIFNACFWFGFINTRVLVPARHLAFTTSLVGEFLTGGFNVSLLTQGNFGILFSYIQLVL